MKLEGRDRRKQRIRKRLVGTPDRPRLSVFRSAKHIYAQVVDDLHGKTLAAVSSLSKELQGEAHKKIDDAKAVGQAIAKLCKDRGVGAVAFDRGGFLYHGRVKVLAEAAREAGLNF